MRNLDTSDNSFKKKWGNEVAEKGFAALPSCLVYCQHKLGITSSEFKTLAHLIACKFTTNHPFPGVRSIATSSGHSTNAVRKHLRDLQQKGIIRRIPREGDSNEYDLSPLIHKLNNHDCVNPIKKRTGVSQPVDTPPSPKTDTKEYNWKRRNNKNTTGLSSIGEIMQKRGYND